MLLFAARSAREGDAAGVEQIVEAGTDFHVIFMLYSWALLSFKCFLYNYFVFNNFTCILFINLFLLSNSLTIYPSFYLVTQLSIYINITKYVCMYSICLASYINYHTVIYNITKLLTGGNLNARGEYDLTALHLASLYGHSRQGRSTES